MPTATITNNTTSRFDALIKANPVSDISQDVNKLFSNAGDSVDFEKLQDRANFTVAGSYGLITLKGSYREKLEEDSNLPISGSVLWNSFTYEVNKGTSIPYGTYRVLGETRLSINLDELTASINLKLTGYRFSGIDGSSWSAKTNAKASVVFDFEEGSNNLSADLDFTEFTYNAVNGDRLTFKGKFSFDESINDYVGWINSITARIDGVVFQSPKIKFSVSDFSNYSTDDIYAQIVSGNDNLRLAEDSNFTLEGYAGDDRLTGNSKDNFIYGGNRWGDDMTGKDIIDGAGGNDYINGGDGADRLSGGTGDDYIQGGPGSDIINGGDGVDRLYGGAGKDTINGGAGDDFIYGEFQSDRLTGGEGSDTFLFNIENFSTRLADQILDFTHGVDKILIEDEDGNKLTVEQSSLLVASGVSSARSAGQVLIYDTVSKKLFYDADQNGNGKGILICTLVGTSTKQFDFQDFA